MAARKVWLIWSETEKPYAEEIAAYFLRKGFAEDKSEEPGGPAAAEEMRAAEDPDETVFLDGTEDPDEKDLPDNPETDEKAAAPEAKDAGAGPGWMDVPPETARRRFLAPAGLAEDSAVVLLSDAATADMAWQAAVRSVPKSFRILPVGGTVQIDYNDPQVLPRRVQEINYILPDENMLVNLEDALLTDPSFYSLRNEVMLMHHMWENSGRDDSLLMASLRKSKFCLKQFESAISREQNPVIRTQLEKGREFLQVSHSKAFLFTLREIRRYARNGLLVLLGAGLLAGFIYIRSTLSRSYYSEILLGVDNRTEDPVTTAVKICEGITNPYVPESAKSRYFGYLSELLEKNWPNTPVGMGYYKWALNDAVPARETRYMYTANGNGQVVRWDTWTGEIVRREKVSDVPLAAVAAAGSGQRAALDGNGRVFLSAGEDASWTDSQTVCPIEWTDAVRMKISGDGKSLLVLDGKSVSAFSIREGQAEQRWTVEAETADADFTADGGVLCAPKRGNRWYAVKISADGQETSWPLAAAMSETCSADVAGDRILFADDTGHVWIWNSGNPEEKTDTGLQLQQPVCLALSEGEWLAYHDRNEGVRVYDCRIRAVLADCLAYAHTVRRLELQDGLLYGFAGNMIYSEDITAVLPQTEAPAEPLRVLSGREDVNSGKTVKSISIENDYLVKMVLALEEETPVLFDPATRYFIGKAELDLSLEDGIPDTFGYYSGITAHFTGRPTLVGIIPEEDTVIMAGYDGSFYEICVAENGDAVEASRTQVPSHAAIRAVYQTEEGYWLEDSAGYYWFKRLGYPAMTRGGQVWLQEVRDKIRMGVSDELLKQVSPQIAEALQLHRFSVREGKEWE